MKKTNISIPQDINTLISDLNDFDDSVACLFFAGLLYILWRLEDNTAYFNIFLEQMNGSSAYIEELATIIFNLKYTQDDLSNLISKGLGFRV